MACNASKTPLLRAIAKRGYAAQACPSTISKSEVKSATLPNKLVVASASSHLPIARVSVVFRAGSRNESYENQGASHVLAIAGGLSTQNATAFGITRGSQQIGSNISASSGRELVTYTIEATSDKLDAALRYLESAVCKPTFKPWEISDSVPRLRYQIKNVSPIDKAVNLVHKAAYRNTLGNSVTCPKYQVGKISTESLLHYFSQNCTTNRAAVVGVGIDQNILQGFAQNLELESGAGKDTPARYYGGDQRKDRRGRLAHVAVAAEGGSLCSQKEALAFAILKNALGASPAVTYGNVNGALGKAIGSVVGDSSASYEACSSSYADSGLFGFHLSVEADKAGKAIEAGVKVLKSGSVSNEDFNRGKALLKACLLSNADAPSALLSSLATQAAIVGDVVSADDLVALVDSVSKSDVDTAAAKVARSKLSIGAIGNLANVPYTSDLA